MPKFNPVSNSKHNKNKMPKALQPTTSQLSTILCIDKSNTANVAAQLDDTGVLGVAEAYISGWTMQDIAKALKGSQVAVMHWENGLKDEDKKLLRQAKTANLEQLENHLSRLMNSELTRHEETGSIDEDMKLAQLADKRIQSIQRVLSATQEQLVRYSKVQQEQTDNKMVVINQINVVSSADKPPLPDYLVGE